jgi:hypothetical protein
MGKQYPKKLGDIYVQRASRFEDANELVPLCLHISQYATLRITGFLEFVPNN